MKKALFIIFALLLFAGAIFAQDYMENPLPKAPEGFIWREVGEYYNPPQTSKEIVYLYLVEAPNKIIEIWYTSNAEHRQIEYPRGRSEVKIKAYVSDYTTTQKFDYKLQTYCRDCLDGVGKLRQVQFFIWGKYVYVLLKDK